MILIADSGSTKTSWVSIAENSTQWACTTGGINPFFLNKEGIIDLLEHEFTLDKNGITAIYFYGAGCTPEKSPLVTEALNAYFQPDTIEVNSDLVAAARSLCQCEEGIACILGTGSNSCYYDGEKIIKNVSPLGYILGDEGSGAVLGKKLISGILKNQFSQQIRQDFQDMYPLSPAEILDRVYRQPFPNRFLAQFTLFIFKHIKKEEIKKLTEDSFAEFVQKNILQYPQAGRLPVHFTGSIAFYFKENLENVLQTFHLQTGKVTQEPLSGLIEYHKKNSHD